MKNKVNVCPFLVHRFGVEVDTSICDGDSCLVHIQANQLPHREKFDFNYQVKNAFIETIKNFILKLTEYYQL